MAVLNVIGDWLEISGWVEALVQAKVASAETAVISEGNTCNPNKTCTSSDS